jgi:uncharacterized protein (TIGR02145 family)
MHHCGANLAETVFPSFGRTNKNGKKGVLMKKKLAVFALVLVGLLIFLYYRTTYDDEITAKSPNGKDYQDNYSSSENNYSSSEDSYGSPLPKCGTKEYDPANQICDSRDNMIYRYANIGKQIWLTENLNYAADSSKCYGDSSSNCNKYGRLYDWATAIGLPENCNDADYCVSHDECKISKKNNDICPVGWHLPNREEWKILLSYVGNDYKDYEHEGFVSTAGTKLKAKNGWTNNNNGTDDYNFAALPGGFSEPSRVISDEYGYPPGKPIYVKGGFSEIGRKGYWWVAECTDAVGGGSLFWATGDESFRMDIYYGKYGLSVRCVKD